MFAYIDGLLGRQQLIWSVEAYTSCSFIFRRWNLLHDLQVTGTWVRRFHRSHIFPSERCRLFHVRGWILRKYGGFSHILFRSLHSRLQDNRYQNYRFVSARFKSNINIIKILRNLYIYISYVKIICINITRYFYYTFLIRAF